MLCQLGVYDVSWGILGAHTHGNVPQHRDRVFIVGIMTCKKTSDFVWPRSVSLTTSLSDFIQEEQEDGLHEVIVWPRPENPEAEFGKGC